MNLKRRLIGRGLNTILVRVFGTGVAFILSVFLARTLGADGFGLYSFSLSLLVFFSIPLQAGLPNLVVRETAKSITRNDWLSIKGLVVWVLKLIILYSVVLSVLLGAVWLCDLELLREERFLIFTVGFVLIPLLPFLIIQCAFLRGLGYVVAGIIPDAIIRPVVTLIIVVAIFYAAKSDLNPLTAMVAYIVAVFIAVFIASILIRKLLPQQHECLTPLTMKFKDWKKAAYPLTIVGGLQLMYSYIDIIILGFFHSNEDVGAYRVVVQLGMLVVFGLTAINQMLHPYFSRLYVQQEIKKLQKIVTYSSLVISGIAVIPALIFLLGGGFVLKTVFGNEFSVGAIPLAILTMGQLANAMFGSVGALLNMTGHEKDAMRGMFYSFILNTILSFVLIPEYGMTGAAISTAISLLVWNIILRNYVKKRLNIEPIGLITLYKMER